MSDEERAREIVRKHIRVDHTVLVPERLATAIASALSAARDEERDRVSTWLRDVPIPSNWATMLADAIAANQHRKVEP